MGKKFVWVQRGSLISLFLAGLLLNMAPDSVGAAGFSPSPEQQRALDRINYYRSLAGVPPARLDPALAQSASSHAAYVGKNGWTGDPHGEDAKKDGFTGASMSDRAAHFGYTGQVNEDMTTSGDPVRAVDSLMNTVSHRTPILEPAYTDIGYGLATGKNAADVVSFGSTHHDFLFNPPIIQWPPNDYLNFGTTFWGESPNIFSGVSFPIGNPVTLTYRGPGKMELVDAETHLTDQDGSLVGSVSGTGSTYTTRNTFVLAARQKLAPDHTYTATMVYKVDGQKQTRTIRFATGDHLYGGPTLTPALLKSPLAIRNLWSQVDGPVAQNQTQRTWLYGPDISQTLTEPYVEAPNGQRNVWYFDKARLEIIHPGVDPGSEWYVTSGLLPKELIGGQIQTGDNQFQPAPGPATVPVAGDVFDNPQAPTYASFASVASLHNDHRSDDRTGRAINESLSVAGQVNQLTPPADVKYGLYDKTLGHNIAQVFVASFKDLPRDWVFIVGLPLTEPYWSRVKVGGVDKDVLIQVFERRVLTYTPSNTARWQVEMGNVGLHYRLWRYPQK